MLIHSCSIGMVASGQVAGEDILEKPTEGHPDARLGSGSPIPSPILLGRVSDDGQRPPTGCFLPPLSVNLNSMKGKGEAEEAVEPKAQDCSTASSTPARRRSAVSIPARRGSSSARWLEGLKTPATRMQFMSMLRKLKIFKMRSNQFLEVLSFKFRPALYEPGTHVVKQGDAADWMAICLVGSADVMLQRKKDQEKVSELRPGMIFGELCVFGVSQRRETSVVATGQGATMLTLTQQGLREALDEVPSETTAFDGIIDVPLEFNLQKLVETKAFENLSKEFLSRLQDYLSTQLFIPGEKMMREGQLGDACYILHRGCVSIEQGGCVVAELKDHAILGEVAVLGSNKRRTATVICKSWCIVQVLSGADFSRVLEEFPPEQAKFQDQISKRMCQTELPSIRRELHGLNVIMGLAHPDHGQPRDSHAMGNAVTPLRQIQGEDHHQLRGFVTAKGRYMQSRDCEMISTSPINRRKESSTRIKRITTI